MTLPNFLIFGALKCGTTSLHSYLKQHPQVYMAPIKEPRFFCYDENIPECRDKPLSVFPIRTLDEYKALFEGVSEEKAIGEASPQYLRSWTTPGRIKTYIPEVKLIASLRNPVDRAYSEYIMSLRTGGDRRPFSQEFSAPDRFSFNLYFEHVKRYYDKFDRSQIKIVLQEDLKINSQGVMHELFDFLEVDTGFVPDVSEKKFVGGIPKRRMLHRLLNLGPRARRMLKSYLPEGFLRALKEVKAHNFEKAPPLSEQLRGELLAICRDDIRRLEDLIQRDLSVWLD